MGRRGAQSPIEDSRLGKNKGKKDKRVNSTEEEPRVGLGKGEPQNWRFLCPDIGPPRGMITYQVLGLGRAGQTTTRCAHHGEIAG